MTMRVSFLSLIVALLALSYVPHVNAQVNASNTFTTNLSLGARGTQVTLLQQILNRDLDTRIASTGPGSPGYETGYFGLLTKAAVVRFQEKYASEVLALAGLTQGNGYVGLYTRAKLNALSSPTTNASGPTSLYPNTPVPAGVNPNTINLDYEIALVTKVGKEEGVSDEKIQQEIQNIKEITATTTNLGKTFFSSVALSRTPSSTLSFTDKVSNSLETVFLKSLSFLGLWSVAQASDWSEGSNGSDNPTVPFGGHIVFVYPCTCTGGKVWRVTLSPPLPPSYAALLDAPVGTQLFASYNSPLEGIYDLGEYEPGVPSCIMYYGTHCSPNVIPGWGTITPFTGSSPSPSLVE